MNKSSNKFWEQQDITRSSFWNLALSVQIGDFTPQEIAEMFNHPFYRDGLDDTMPGLLKGHKVYENTVDTRSIVCACGKEGCKIGVSFDELQRPLMYLTDKYGNDHSMTIDKDSAAQIIAHLKELNF
jgi:hypothetical protein